MVWIRRYMRIPQELKPSEIFKQNSLSPSKIFMQIFLLQVFYYLTAYTLFYSWATLCGYDFKASEWLFSWELIDFSNSFGISLVGLWLLDSLICVIFLTVIVGRSKLAWDFAVTIHAINLVVVWFHTKQFPSFSWFLLQLASSLILVFLGTWTTRWRELRDTFFEGLVDDESFNGNRAESSITNSDQQREQFPLKDLEAQK
ncbi:HHR012Wp [Eremothecium sinecaudum]|uniref:HHR012Wp n=1 Tax=Eremothecium sinecaudum TaxID=45286 RepID=A0A0X8HW25_9SACH|nr:HHR012Wp [Eremothecium sinecaudum]AMD22781.1 HHR012Wp [Eremothecium sinecaudum]